MSCKICLCHNKRYYYYYFRNLNTIRAIAHEHGDPVDRYSVLARTATKSAFKMEGSIAKKILNLPTILIFEVRLQ